MEGPGQAGLQEDLPRVLDLPTGAGKLTGLTGLGFGLNSAGTSLIRKGLDANKTLTVNTPSLHSP